MSESPVLSVVILGWRLADRLVRAVQAVLDQADDDVEVLVVLNGADDVVRAAVARELPHVAVVDLPVNIGFGGGSNAGAAAARGSYIAFLNDDTEVQPGWVDAMLEGAATHPDAGILASVLLNADDTIQEAGSRMLSDGSTVPIGAGLMIDEASQLLHDRLLDYGSGAAIALPAEHWRALGGFDPIYHPAYYEDVDLAFRSRLIGRPVVLVADARVRHVGRASTADRPSYQRFASEHGSQAFAERWGAVLVGAPDADAPLDQLCPVEGTLPPPGTPRSPGLDQVIELATELGALRRTAASSRDQVAWLDEEIRTLRGRLIRIDELAERIADLESRGPIGIIAWRLGIWVRRHPWWRARFRRLADAEDTTG